MGFWIIDSIVNTILFNDMTFFENFLPNFENNSFYYRLFFISMVLIGSIIYYLLNNRFYRDAKIGINLINRLSNGLIARDADGKIIYINDILAEKLGYNKEDMLKRPVRNYIFGKKEYKKLTNIIQNPKPYDITMKSINATPIYTIFSPLKIEADDEDGEIIDLVTDISHIKILEEELIQERKQLFNIIDNINNPVYIADPETYRILYTNRAFNKIWKDGKDNLCFKHVQGLNSPCPFCTNRLIFDKEKGKTYTWEYRNKKTGDWFRCVDMVIKWNNDRMVKYEMMININDEKESDFVYKTNDNKYETLFNNMKNPYVYHQIIWDGNGKPIDYRIIEANKAFEDISGLRMDKIIGKKISEVIPNIVKEPINNLKRYEKVVLEESEATFEQYWSSINRWYRIKAYLPERGYFATIFEDITKEKEKII